MDLAKKVCERTTANARYEFVRFVVSSEPYMAEQLLYLHLALDTRRDRLRYYQLKNSPHRYTYHLEIHQ